jgi:preprotein translocase subunit SecD
MHLSFNEIGGKLLKDLTVKNVPSLVPGGDQVKRHLAIIVNGLIVSAPTINSPIERSAQITGNFRVSEMDRFVRLLLGNVPKG